MDTFWIYKDRAGQWRWHLKSPNGRMVADSVRGYVGKASAIAAAQRLADRLRDPVNLVIQPQRTGGSKI